MNYPQIMPPVPFASKSEGHVSSSSYGSAAHVYSGELTTQYIRYIGAVTSDTTAA